MKTRLLLTTAVLSLTFIISGICADSTEVPELNHYKAIYEKEIAKLAAKTQYQRLHIPQDHIKALRKLEAEYQASGDLRSLLAVRSERERFISDPRVDHIEPVESPAKLRDLQLAYIKNYRVIKAKRKQDAVGTRNKYIEILQGLQKKLTQQGKIDEALAVMKEIESVQNSGISLKTSPSTLANTADNSDTGSFDEPHSASSGTLDTKTIQSLLKGDVSRWNPYKYEITVTYDFSDSDQTDDWKGGRIEGVRRRLTCNRSISWLKLQFANIKRIEIDMIPASGTMEAGMVIGRDLTMLMGKDRNIEGKIFQSSEESPIIKAVIEPSYGDPYSNIFTLNDRQISWVVNNERPRHGVLEEPLTYPTFIGVGCLTSESSYSKVTVTGTLSSKMIQRLKAQLQNN